MPSNLGNICKAHDDLMKLEANIQENQAVINQLQEDIEHVRPAVEKIQQSTTKNTDVDRLD